MDFGDSSSRDGLESIARDVAMSRGCRGRVAGVVVAGVGAWFVRVAGVVVTGPPWSSHARSSADRSRWPCSFTSSSRRVSSSCVSLNPTCRMDALSARAGRPMRSVYPSLSYRSTKRTVPLSKHHEVKKAAAFDDDSLLRISYASRVVGHLEIDDVGPLFLK